jgi:hypothetical protein
VLLGKKSLFSQKNSRRAIWNAGASGGGANFFEDGL